MQERSVAFRVYSFDAEDTFYTEFNFFQHVEHHQDHRAKVARTPVKLWRNVADVFKKLS